MKQDSNPLIIQKFVATDFPNTIFYVIRSYPCQEVYRAYVTGRGGNRILGFYFEERNGELFTNSPNTNIKGLRLLVDQHFQAEYLQKTLTADSQNVVTKMQNTY